MTDDDWHDGTRRTLGIYLADDSPDRACDDAFLIWFHGGADAVQVELPDGSWAHTYRWSPTPAPTASCPRRRCTAGSALQLPGRTVVVLQVD